MRRIDIGRIDLGDHRKYFEEPLRKALEVLSSTGENGSIRRRLKIGARFLNKLAYSDDARGYFAVFYRRIKSTGITIAKTDDLCDLVYEDEQFRVQHHWRSIRSPLPRFKRNDKRGTLDVCLDVLRRLFSYAMFYHGMGWRFDGVCDLTAINISKDIPKSDWRAWKFIQQVIDSQNVHFCPYCNASTVYAYDTVNTTSGFMESALDHFCPKNRYPYLAISLYNLVPSCQRCNSGAKTMGDPVKWVNGKVKFKLSHPYQDDFHSSLKFEYGQMTAKLLSGGGTKNDIVLITVSKDALQYPLAMKSVEEFRLLKVYENSFWRYLADLPARWNLSRTGYFATSRSFLRGGLTASQIERYLIGAPIKEDEINNHHLGKLTLDLLEQLDERGLWI